MAEATSSETAEKHHERASKVATYFGASGVLSWGLTAVAILLHPFTLPGLLLIGTGVALAANEKGRGFLRKAGDQLVELGNDLMSHLSEDVGRLSRWWHRVTGPKQAAAPAAAPVAKAAAEAPVPGMGLVQAPGFNQAAKPEAAPQVADEPAPKASGHGPKIDL